MPEHDEYFSSEQDPYIDQNTQTLINIPNLQTPEKLEAFEEVIFQANFADASNYIASQETIDLESWKKVHKICFSDVYEWAGKLRTVRIAKGNTVFAYPENIQGEANKLFSKLNDLLHAHKLTHDKVAELFSEINVLHPFRDGNGRTQRILFSEIYKRIGYTVDYNLTTQTEIIEAMVEGYKANYEPAKHLLQKITQKAE